MSDHWGLREDGHGPKDLPAVALTAVVQKNGADLALLSGFKCLPKPVDPHELTLVIARHGTNPVDSDVVAIRGA